MEVVLGIDNIVFISVLVSRLPPEQADRARRLGLALALVFRIALLAVLTWIIGLSQPLFSAFGHDFSWKDIILIGGGLFLIYKATHEMHAEIEEPHEPDLKQAAGRAFSAIIAQIIVIDMVFSIDSIITAVGMAQQIEVMIAAVIVAVGIMFVASGPIAGFVAKHPTTKMPVLVEAINIISEQRKLARQSGAGQSISATKREAAATVPDNAVAEAVSPTKPRRRSTPSARAQSRPKSAPRK
jgi:predicted tellurium resistance membrane protein TerC